MTPALPILLRDIRITSMVLCGNYTERFTFRVMLRYAASVELQ
jgi:hypothetical protein